jgi:hypothetical protein
VCDGKRRPHMTQSDIGGVFQIAKGATASPKWYLIFKVGHARSAGCNFFRSVIAFRASSKCPASALAAAMRKGPGVALLGT